MHTTVSTKGQIVLPAEIRKRDGIEPGQEFEVDRIKKGEYLIRRRHRPSKKGLVDWLLSSPEKGWFQSLDRTATTDEIKPPKLR